MNDEDQDLDLSSQNTKERWHLFKWKTES